MGQKMQVIAVNDNGMYRELVAEADRTKFLQEHEIEKLVEGLKEKYSGCQLAEFEIDSEKYLSVKGSTSEITTLRHELLKNEGTVKSITDIQHSQQLKQDLKKAQKARKNNVEKKIDSVVKKEDRNIFDVIESYTKLLTYLVNDIFSGIYGKKGKKLNTPDETKIDEKSKDKDIIQVIAVEKPDGTIVELKSEYNPNLFLQKNELEAYAKDIAEMNGTFRLIEIKKKDYPDVNQFLERGIMTKEGKEKYQSAKIDFFKKYNGTSVTCEIKDCPQKKEVKKQETKPQKKSKQNVASGLNQDNKKKNNLKRKRR